ncbi:efflux RND transporter periplasmic adaptor subunit [Spirosoma utsteinense]|uniref:RND family efflux transporter MFP subunit n=1 Tax=Spirosoma utsteinense TaxID=2585773 RepID=A0ABR6W0X6_9BACT|nr:efflux RND transporter periplasmic adaptor subunit [Spirosoma utsteinense]MBC3783619.1 RND family efflux transporter MFP subunit [Spirosoma utsteinense]MBC3790239.1 RND family efflux transporter MFP subunit [Spirosoma utsteinense]
MKAYYAIALMTSLLMACSAEKKNDLQSKREELATLKAEQVELTTKIKAIEADVTKLDPKKTEEARVKDVTVSPVSASTFRHFVELQGTIDAKNNVQVSPKSGGVVTAVYVKEGDNVRAGQPIAKVDDQILRESLGEIKTQLSLANTVYEKQAALWNQQIGTEIQYLQAKNNKESLERRLSTLNVQLNQSTVTAPISGVVDQVIVKVGQSAAPGIGLVRIVNLSQLKVVAKVADSYAGSVRKGDAVMIEFPDLSREMNSRISFVSTTVDPLSRTFTIEAPLPSDNALKPNMLARIKINDETKANAITINQNLIQSTENGQLVYIAVTEGNRKVAKARPVKTGPSYGGKITITEGLQAGDQIVTAGYQDLVDGQPISF